MTTLEAISKQLEKKRAELKTVRGTPTEVYTRIVGYYRSVANWNAGKREEYDERVLFKVPETSESSNTTEATPIQERASATYSVLLFVQDSCPLCPSAKEAARTLDIPVTYIDVNTEEGFALAKRYGVYATPTAFLLDAEHTVLATARNSVAIKNFKNSIVTYK
ncbi:MAG TPA: anaerobic ribonucleoside-triphosphate reductase [Methanofastidiosum sp.]|nr:anaerobic ribonucleoside-triphosphate reductase [Methanofastidiosum sp.]